MASKYTTTIICLANSRKPGGRCVAGKMVQNKKFGGWIRPVGARSGGELSDSDRQFTGGAEPALLDVIDIDMLSKAPHAYQPENHTINDRAYWRLVRKANFSEALFAVDKPQADLWGTSFGSSYSGTNDRVPVASAPSFNYSLRLIEVDDLRIHVSAEGAAFNNPARKLRGISHIRASAMRSRLPIRLLKRNTLLVRMAGSTSATPCFVLAWVSRTKTSRGRHTHTSWSLA